MKFREQEFRVGDIVRTDCGYTFDPAIGIIKEKNGTLCKVKIIEGQDNLYFYRLWNCEEENLTLIKKGGTMNLTDRINALTAWDKEADDILQELHLSEEGMDDYFLKIKCNNSNSASATTVEILQCNKNTVATFPALTQCNKLEAFKKALLWLLDKSGLENKLEGTTQKVKIAGKVYEAEIISEVK